MLLTATIVNADEGFRLYDQLPLDRISERTGVHLTPSWLLNLQQSTARYNGAGGGSASFVSADGLVLTNFHVNRPILNKLTTATRDLIRDGFLARTPDDEIKLPGVSLDVLMSVTDVTAKVRGAGSGNSDDPAAQQARRGVIHDIEVAATTAPGTAAEVVTLFEGGRYVLYQYKRYTDVRLVFSPEYSVVGEPPNTHPLEALYPAPRLDFAFIRAYENNRPAHPPRLLRQPLHHVITILGVLHKWIKVSLGISPAPYVNNDKHITVLCEIVSAIVISVTDVWGQLENYG